MKRLDAYSAARIRDPRQTHATPHGPGAAHGLTEIFAHAKITQVSEISPAKLSAWADDCLTHLSNDTAYNYVRWVLRQGRG
jgi:hypothetical protein